MLQAPTWQFFFIYRRVLRFIIEKKKEYKRRGRILGSQPPSGACFPKKKKKHA